jgi:hypothetical protein
LKDITEPAPVKSGGAAAMGSLFQLGDPPPQRLLGLPPLGIVAQDGKDPSTEPAASFSRLTVKAMENRLPSFRMAGTRRSWIRTWSRRSA